MKYLAPWLTRIDIEECRWNHWHTKYLLDTTYLLLSIKSGFSVRVNHHFHHVLSLHLSKPVKTAWMIAVSLHSSSVFLWTLIIISICVELRIYLTIHHAITIGIVGWWYNATWFSSINYRLLGSIKIIRIEILLWNKITRYFSILWIFLVLGSELDWWNIFIDTGT